VIARAPGKIILSGAYAVLEGAPAIVAAVDRYAVADSARSSAIVTEEVLAAMTAGILDRVPWFDASGLRARMPDGMPRKIGLGSSAAILVASLGAVIGEQLPDEGRLRDALYRIAVDAHRAAQPHTGGLDAAASVRGGVLTCRLDARGALDTAPHVLPPGLSLEVFACPTAASSSRLFAAVQALRKADPAMYRRLLGVAAGGARAAAEARDVRSFVYALAQQTEALGALGRAASAPIVLDPVAELGALASTENATFGPSGAGGGDIALWAGPASPSSAFLARAAALGLTHLPMRIGARGLHLS
jgi:phosphomevalonate kinase